MLYEKFMPIYMKKSTIYKRDNKLYIAVHPNDNISKTYWHFKNIDVILANLFGFDIHNYLDEVVEYDMRKKTCDIIKNKTLKISLNFAYSNSVIFCYYSPEIISNYTSTTDDFIMIYFTLPLKQDNAKTRTTCGIKIPRFMIQRKIDAVIDKSNETVILRFYDESQIIEIKLKFPNIPFYIDFGNHDDTIKYILNNNDLLKYQKLHLQSI